MVTTTPEVARQTGATTRQLHHWVANGWLHPDNARQGSGTQWDWPAVEVATVSVGKPLIDVGLRPELALRLGRQVAEYGAAHAQAGHYHIYVERKPKQL